MRANNQSRINPAINKDNIALLRTDPQTVARTENARYYLIQIRGIRLQLGKLVGAPLPHAAIVARELGIPAVVGCSNATTRLKTGDIVIVAGGQGIVHIK